LVRSIRRHATELTIIIFMMRICDKTIKAVEKDRTLFISWGTLDLRLFILSAFILFLELFLIRWVSAEIRIFAYVNNLVLLACFIGMGSGCYFSGRKVNYLLVWLSLAGLVLMARSSPFIRITDFLGGFPDSNIWDYVVNKRFFSVLSGVSLTIGMFFAISTIFFPLGQMLGRMFNEYSNTAAAYSFNALGSIAGVWVFGAICGYFAPPWVWLLTGVCLGLVFFKKKEAAYHLLFIFIAFSAILYSRPGIFAVWTPYQKLEVFPAATGNGYNVLVNGTGYMHLLDISEEFTKKHFPDLARFREFNQYEIPFMFKKNVDSALIVGSGGGNDVAGALRQGVKSIDAVEIDPGVYYIGGMLHPERPYQDKRVNIFIDDARSFFKKAGKLYDAVCFGLLDAHTGSSSYNNIRLDHYVYTLESFGEAKKLLKENGIMTVVFDAKREWVGPRIFRLLRKVFGKDPLVFLIRTPGNVFGWGGLMFIAGPSDADIQAALDGNKPLKELVDSNKVDFKGYPVRLTTDDWPYLYLKNNSIPSSIVFILVSLVVIFVIGGVRIFAGSGRLNLHFFFLGAAFLLLEFQNISKSSLLFGSTWLVNSLNITAILTLILLANWFAYSFKIRNTKPFYALLFVSVLALYLFNLASLNISNYYLRAALSGIFLNMPVFFAGVIFIQSFKSSSDKSLALGSNLLGACMGGLLESLSFITGIRALLLFVLAFYILSYWFRPKVQNI